MGDNNDDSAMNIRHESQEEEVRRNRSSLAEPSHLSHNDENENEDATGFETETTTGTGTSSTARTATRTSMSPPVDPQHPIEDGIGDESNTNNSHHDSLLVPESSSIDPRNATESIDPSSSSEDDGSGNDEDEDEDDDEDNNSNNDNNNYNNNYNNSDTSELIRLASAAAIRDATKMKRSDSDLSHSTTTYSNNEEEEEDDDDILEELLEENRNQQRTGSGRPSMSLSQTYMEQASYEASLVENDGKGEGDASGPHRFRRTQLKPSGKLGRIAHRHSSQGIIDVVHGGDDDSDSDSNSNSDSDKHGDPNDAGGGQRRASEFEKFHSVKSMRGLAVDMDVDVDVDVDADADADAEDDNGDGDRNDSDSDEAVSGAGEKRSGSVLERTKSSARNGQRQHEHEHEQQHETPRPVFPAALHTESVRASALAEVLAHCGMDVDVANPFPDPDPSQPPNKTEEYEHDVFARYLYALFDGFCRPPLELDSVRKIVELERCRHRHRQSKSQSQSQSQSQSSSHDTPATREEANVPLPVGIVVQRPSAVLINVLVGSASSPSTSPSTSAAALHSKRLPPVFASSLFRILLRLLEGYTDAQYDSCVVLASCAWQHEAATSSSSKARAQHPGRTEPSQSTTASSSKTTTTTPTKTTTPMETPPGSSRDDEPQFVGTTNDTAANANLVYSIARLRMQWEHSVRSVLRALTSMLTVRGYHPKKRQQQQQQQQQQQEYNRRYEHLVYPMIRLLGLLCAGGVTVEELRTMISLAATVASDTTAASVATVARWVLPDTMKVLMIRALAVAASTTACNSNSGGSRRMSSTTSLSSSSSPTLVMMGKANLRTFFSFVSGPGMRRTIHLDDPQQQATWPFRNDFGTAFSFRAEDFFSASPPPNSNDSSRNAGDSSCILLQALSETGSGIVISLVPLDSQKQSKQTKNRKQLEPHATKDDNTEKSMSTAAVISIKTVENHKVVDCVKVNNCPLHARVWYHIAIRHTRSRLKGVFSLSSREQMTVLLDGKQMLVEAMQFPQLRHESKSKKSLSFTVGKNFDGQIGSIYVFRDNVSDATFKAIYDRTSAEATITTTTRSGRAVDFREDNQPMRVSTTTTSRNIRSDDLEHLAFSSSGREGINRTIDTADLCEDEDTSDASNPLSKSSFISRLYLCWNPRRRENNFLMELHSGVHASLDRECVQAVCIESAQQVIGSIGGIQILLSIFQSILGEKNLEITRSRTQDTFNEIATCSLVPDLLNLLSCFVRGNYQNARELLRCGGIDLVEQLLLENKIRGINGIPYKKHSIVRALFKFPTLSKLLVQNILELQSSCKHYASLETKVFSTLLFNTPLWLEGQDQELYISIYPAFLPILSNVVLENTVKVRDFVKVTDIIWLIRNIVELKYGTFQQVSSKPNSSGFSNEDRRQLIDTLLAWVFQIFSTGPARDDISAFVSVLSKYLEGEWDATTREISDGQQTLERPFHRGERLLFLEKACTIFYYSLDFGPLQIIEDFARVCGGIDNGVAWLLSSLVNSYNDHIRSLGIRCVCAYVRATAHGSDLPLSFSSEIKPSAMRQHSIASVPGKLQENTISLISQVGQGFLTSSEKKYNEATETLAPSKLTPRVIYQLLWHLLKSHRYRMGIFTQTALIGMVFENKDHFVSKDTLMKQLVKSDPLSPYSMKIDFEWTKSTMAKNSVDRNSRIRDALSMNTILRALCFLPTEYSSRWLDILVQLSKSNPESASIITSCRDWQPCLFQFISEVIENMASTMSTRIAKTEETHGTEEKDLRESPLSKGSSTAFDLSLELYSILLGHIVRNNGDKSIVALEEAAALQRVYVNGPEVFALIVSHLLENLSQLGVVPFDQQPRTNVNDTTSDQCPNLLKSNAKIVTDAILSGTKLSTAIVSWRFLKYLAMSTTAFIHCLNSNAEFHVDSQKDGITSGHFGILLPEGVVGAIEFENLMKMYTFESVGFVSNKSTSKTLPHDNLQKRLSVHIAVQMLSLLDVFIFPEDSTSDLKASQLQGLSLVRGTETQIGDTQGPLLASLMRDSLLLLCRLEPSSVKMLQCCGRLRCFVHYSLELVRESEALERYSVTFNKITLPFDRLLLSSFIRSHFALQKCAKLLNEIESDSTKSKLFFANKEARKRSYRRIFRVTIELREILMTIYEKRSSILRNSLTQEAIVAFQSCIEPPAAQDGETGTSVSAQKETLVRALLASDWVQKFQMTRSRKSNSITLVHPTAESMLANESIFVQNLGKESSEIEKAYQKSLNAAFEEYLEKQRKWAETSAVRDLEFKGDTALKLFSNECKHEGTCLSKDIVELSSAAKLRWAAIERKVGNTTNFPSHSKLPTFTDQNGRRILLVPNSNFDSHQSASYDLMMGQDRQRGENGRKELNLQNELSDLMKRNHEALSSYDEILALDDDHDDARKDVGDAKEESELVGATDFSSPEIVSVDSSETDWTVDEFVPDEEIDVGGDEWAKAFIWEDNESIVARFEEVMMVTLRYTFDGHLLLTTEGLYFHQIGRGVNVISKEPCPLQKSDRRWRLNGLREVHGRRYLLRTQALELFFADGQELFFNFTRGQKERNRFYAKLRNSCRVPMIFSPKSLNPRAVFKKTRITELWKKRKVSNFEYLMALNRMAGRTFNDISQYPVFPWILADYESDKIDLNDSRVYRDLSKPVGALNPDRLAILIERYQELESFGFSPEEKFLYGSHYSSPGLVLHFLIRQEPFTSMAIDLQSGRFDCADRLFFDLSECWKSCNRSSSDVKELIPELFTMPEMLQNTNKFPLGKTQKGIFVNDVALPPWAKGSAHEFVRIHRLALESEYVSSNLQNWIDLVFGYKQRGLEAEKAWNVFHFLSYEGSVDLDKMKDDLDRAATESHIQNFGQTPSQLIVTTPHPSRYGLELSWKPLINNVATAVRLRCHTPFQQFGGKSGRGAGAVVHIYVKADALIAVYSDLKVGFFWWSPKSATNRLQPDRLQSLPSRDLSYSRSVMKRGSAVPQTVGERTSPFAVGNWSFATTIGGYENELLRRRNTVVPSRLASAKDALYTDAAPLLVSCGYWDNTIKVHSTDAWKLEASDDGGHRGVIRCLAIGGDGGIFVTGGEDCTCRVWVVDHPEMAAVLSDGYMQTALGRPPNENQILTCCHVLIGHESAISCVALSSELDIAASGSVGGRICIHILRTGEFVRSFSPPTRTTGTTTLPTKESQEAVPVTKIVLEEHGRIVIQMGDSQLYTYTINGSCLCSVNAGEQIHDMKITGEVLVTGGENGHVYIRDLSTLKILSGLNLSKHGPIRCVSFTPSDLNPIPQFLFIGSDDGMISVVEQNL